MNVGDLVPDFQLADQYGKLRSLGEFLAEGVVVLFFYPAAMTKGCTAESCYFRDMAAEFKELNALRVGISLDSVDKQREFSDTYSFDYPLLSDSKGEVSKLFGVKRPIDLLKVKRQTFIVGQDFRVKAVFRSETNMKAHADEALAFLKVNS
ncbi:peroxiredoxin Q/BCP [Ferrithrix thermotolerans DSM 19514]|jgi:peroxiredoxin Q/BCP|uniref:thioredoxin-dependent peroxiredoxin n=1 Tax=Ferrithrix thermotolerans DSM 19514 TaxID=1121881 RepID=A0A1M4XI98_9ACTN|nr:peroxiredoxin [Ferrithrix thermotolerans]SHE93121.1 peroxiredoxin Q/BCP [Ferrithrix thermotolerans DSM 19514]